MTFRQRVIKFLYPLIMKLSKKGKFSEILVNKGNIRPGIDFFSIQAETGKGEKVSLEKFRGKKIVVVNTASDCGYTGQYAELQKLHEIKKDDLTILAFPSNDFKEQEKGNDSQIASFCEINYGVTFPLMKKTSVLAKDGQNSLYKWLTDKNQNGWNVQEPLWNFSKYVIDEEGKLTHFFGSAVSPLSKEFMDVL